MAGLFFHVVVLHPAKLSSDSTNLLLLLCDVLLHISTVAMKFVSTQLLSALISKPSDSFYFPSIDLYSQEVRAPTFIGAKISGI